MSERVKKNKHFLLLFRESGPAQRRVLLSIANRSQFLSLLECGANCLVGNVPIDSKSYKRLQNKRAIFQALAFDKKKCWKKKRELVNKRQVGGILSSLVATAAGYLFDKLLSRKASAPPSPPRPPPSPPPLPRGTKEVGIY